MKTSKPTDTRERERKQTTNLSREVRYQLLIDCRDERTQRFLFERLRAEGFAIRVLTL